MAGEADDVRILITNDDGFAAPGLWALVRAVKPLGEVIVAAPDREQSGVGASFSLHHPIRIRRLATRGVKAYAIEGTPGDAVILALGYICKDAAVDVVLAGINQGSNMGNDVLLSGTVGAALQGHFRDIPSAAISVASLTNVRYETAAKIGRSLVRILTGNPEVYRQVLLCVNVPNVRPHEIQGAEITRLARRSYVDDVNPGNDGRRDFYWITRSRPVWEIEEGTDVWAVRSNRIAITPLQTDMTAYRAFESLTVLRNAVREDLGLTDLV